MRIRITDADREALSEWLADLAFARDDEAVDALADARHARVEHAEGREGFVFSGRVLLLTSEGVEDVETTVQRGRVRIAPWPAPAATPTTPEPA